MTDKICDCCSAPWTKEMNSKTSEWCAAWFYGKYCEECFDIVENYMQKEYYLEKILTWLESSPIIR